MSQEITQLLREASRGNRAAFDAVFPRVYQTLRRIAARKMDGEGVEHSLSPTALVHEAYLKLGDGVQTTWHNRSQFYAIAARAMRQILVDHALAKRAEKRGGTRLRVTLDEGGRVAQPKTPDVLALEQALVRLEASEPRRAQVVVCRFYGGMRLEETAAALGVSEATVKRDWIAARVWLNRRLERSPKGERRPELGEKQSR